MDVVGYIRVSREDENPENQEFAITKFVATHGLRLVAVYKDVGMSGSVPPAERPGWQQVMKDLESGRAKGVVVYALDRIARSLWELASVYKEFAAKGWVIFSVREEWLSNVDPKIRDFLVAVLGWAGEMEREFIRERTKEAIARAKAQGKRVGRPPVWSEEKRRRVIDLVRRGFTLKEAAKMAGVSYRTAVRKLARDPEYLEAVKQARLLGLRKRADVV
ncbi:MAG: recombinase family protein [Pyrobaculum sp.]